MGDFRLMVDAVGGHGCDRGKGDGETVYGCGRMDCPDCITAAYLADMARAGVMLKDAVLVHWPGSEGQVLDTFNISGTSPPAASSPRIPRTRHGEFPK